MPSSRIVTCQKSTIQVHYNTDSSALRLFFSIFDLYLCFFFSLGFCSTHVFFFALIVYLLDYFSKSGLRAVNARNTMEKTTIFYEVSAEAHNFVRMSAKEPGVYNKWVHWLMGQPRVEKQRLSLDVEQSHGPSSQRCILRFFHGHGQLLLTLYNADGANRLPNRQFATNTKIDKYLCNH